MVVVALVVVVGLGVVVVLLLLLLLFERHQLVRLHPAMTQIEMFVNKNFFKQSHYIFYPIGTAMYVRLHDHCAINICDRQI